MKKNQNNKISWPILGSFLAIVISVILLISKSPKSTSIIGSKINTMLMLIEFERIEGIEQWEKELYSRGLTALVKVQDNVLEENPTVFKRLANKGYEIAGGYDKAPFWDMSYDEQYKYLKESKDLVEKITGKKMRVFGSRYFAYDETTLKAADALGIEYILGRGVNDVEAIVYQPKEYKVRVISVTNVDVGEPMGRGSLCDYSLWSRGADAIEFGQILDDSILKKPTNMILVSHAYLGGTRLEWWAEYERVLSSDKIVWNNFDNWLKNQKIITLANAEIPMNKEVKYVQPKPAKPMEDYKPIPGIDNTTEKSNSSDDGTMCL
ncbi:MAG TPA: polysaccharide deacetylase family protein [Candidatus Woesebacteria bacterium]|nr:polysaccharide deacetylase family protein [Candidatus Shapirobacteria bacterium]HOR01900.1 polysaccharide deacetylase family protein [Candidatus Woesebacteria bacterium]